MLSFQWKYKKLRQIEGSWKRPGGTDIFTGLDPGFCMCQNGIRAKETEADIAEQVFSKGQHELKTLNVFF